MSLMACDCGGKGLGLDGFHYEGAEGCLRPRAAATPSEGEPPSDPLGDRT